MIPIAYIPPHSSSVSIADAHRDAYGHSEDDDRGALAYPGQHHGPARGAIAGGGSGSAGLRASVPASMASRDSLALAGAELIELNPLPPVLSPDTPAVPLGATANGAPIRPPRSPGLDLNLPKISSPLAAGASSPSQSQAFLSPAAAGSRGMSVLMDQQSARSDENGQRARSAQSHLSTFTTRSGNSTMSYILDPPQIITPVSAQGVRRVELHQGQAGLIKIGGGAASQPRAAAGLAAAGGAAAIPLPHSPTSPVDGGSGESAAAAALDPFDDVNEERRLSGLTGSRESLRQSTARPVSSATDMSRWTSSSFASDALEGGVQFLQGQTVTFTNPNSPMPMPAGPPSTATTPARTVSGASFDVPTSARSSEAFETGAATRALTNQDSAWSLATVKGDATLPPAPDMAPSQSRDSAASVSTSATHMSVLEGIPFLGPSDPKRGSGGSVAGRNVPGAPMARQVSATSSISLGLPVNVAAAPGDTSVSSLASSTPPTTVTPSPSLRPATISSLDGGGSATGEEEDDLLPAPFLPFAGQRPSSSDASVQDVAATGGGRVQSTAISVRSGFGSGLSQIPFQLGFPSGFGEGEDEDGDGDGDGNGNGDGDGDIDEEGEREDLRGVGEESDRDGRRSVRSRDSRFPPSEAGDQDEDEGDEAAGGGDGTGMGDSSRDPLRECISRDPEPKEWGAFEARSATDVLFERLPPISTPVCSILCALSFYGLLPLQRTRISTLPRRSERTKTPPTRSAHTPKSVTCRHPLTRARRSTRSRSQWACRPTSTPRLLASPETLNAL